MEAHLVVIGKAIVQKCANVPLAIRVVGSLLRGEGESRWRYMRDTDLANIKQDEINGIIPVLKISYYYLPFHLKSCFSYCCIFPKDHKIIKEVLISLWMAQGFIMSSDGQSLEDAGEEYFNQLLQRCFFQDVERDEGTILSCKMHDLIHDLAKEVAGTEISDASSFNEKTRHLFLGKHAKIVGRGLTKMNRLRTILQPPYTYLDTNANKMRYLRVLDLPYSGMKKLPSMIGEMLHLRYLDLSSNAKLLVLPMSIAQLYNLQTLKLRDCDSLKELPRELRKLVNLRHLDTHGCRSLSHMPQGMNCMTNLHKLTRFVLGRSSKFLSWGSSGDSDDGGLEDLKCLKNLTGNMEIKVQRNWTLKCLKNLTGNKEILMQDGWTYDAAVISKGGYLINKPHLRKINILKISQNADNSEALLQGLQPHSNLRILKLVYYKGVRFPSWGGSSMNLQTCLPNLVQIELWRCQSLEHLPLMSQLRHLKVLLLSDLMELEYVESSHISGDGAAATSGGSTSDHDFVFFPSLENLELDDLPKLKGWWESESGFQSNSSSFHQLSELKINRCPNLTTFPLCPTLGELKIGINIYRFDNLEFDKIGLCSFRAPGPIMKIWSEEQGILREVKIDNVGCLNSLPMESLQHLSHLNIRNDQQIERLTVGEVGEVFRSGCLSSLRYLEIRSCYKLQSLPGRGVLEHFTALETLQLEYLDELELEDDVSSDTDTPWRYLAPTLRSLELSFLPKLVKLPNGIECLSSLQTLQIDNCSNFGNLSSSIGNLSSLQTLTIMYCSNLENLPPSIGGLSSLQTLQIMYCPNFENLPPSIGGLSFLEYLYICRCSKLKSLPEEMRQLTSLTQLHLSGCSPKLIQRCKEQTGEDWPKIKHIPRIYSDY